MTKPSQPSRAIERLDIVTRIGLRIIVIMLLSTVLFYVGYHTYKEMMFRVAMNNLIPVNHKIGMTRYFYYSEPNLLTGTDFVMLPLRSRNTYLYGIYDAGMNTVCNILFHNVKTKERRWLFNHHNFMVTAKSITDIQPDGISSTTDENVVAMTYTVWKADTDNSGGLSYDDKRTYAISNPDGTGYVELLDNLNGIIRAEQVGDEIHLIYRRGSATLAGTVSISQHALIDETLLPDHEGF